MAKAPRAFRAGRDLAPRFTDLGERADVMAMPERSRRPKKYYPTVSLRRAVRGLGKVGQTRNVRMKVRVNAIELREGDEPRIGLELRGIEEA